MTTKETAEETPEGDKPKDEAKGMRAQIENLSKENRELKADKRDGIISGLGLKADEGIGMVLVEQFDKGDLALDGIVKASEKYGHVVPEVQPQQNPMAGQIAQSQQALDNIGQTAGSIAPPTDNEQLAKAEADKDFNTTIAMKSAQIGEMLRNK